MSIRARDVSVAFCAFVLAAVARAGVTFEIKTDEKVRLEKATGRLVVFVVKDEGGDGKEPVDGPSFDRPQPMYGIDVKDWQGGETAIIDEAAGDRVTSFPVPLKDLPAGSYVAQARLDMFHLNSEWRREPGNMWSAPAKFKLEAGKDVRVAILLDKVVQKRDRQAAGVEIFEVQSRLLSEFHGRDVTLRAGVIVPENLDRARKYGAVYEIPGFGGDHTEAFATARGMRGTPPGSPPKLLAGNCFWIFLDPESGNGHTLFADSANNGPCGEALVNELIPALEKKYNLEPRKDARLLRGHSSGGWSSLWLAVTYPNIFGACWASSPDPVDFRRFQLTDLYGDASFFEGKDGKDTPSYRAGEAVRMTVRQENAMEEVLGPGNTSGQQWDSWQAVFGPKGKDGSPAALYDPGTGNIDRDVAEGYKKYDLNALLGSDSASVGAIFKQRVRLVVGEKDSYFLNGAVQLLKERLDSLGALQLSEKASGYVKVVPSADHDTVFMSKELRAFPVEMVEWLKKQGLMK